MSDEHESFIKTPKQLIWIIVLSFVIPIAIIVLLVKFVAAGDTPAAGADALSAEAIEARIRPVAGFQLASSDGAAAAPKTGQAVYDGQCAACHATGAAGAPKFADKDGWAARIGQDYDALLNSALKGKGAMAPQAGGQFSDLEIGRAVVLMVNAAGGELAEPGADQATTASDAPKPEAPAATTPKAEAAVPAAKSEAEMIAQPAAAAAPAAAGADGEAIYKAVCATCHSLGLAGAPKIRDKQAWAPRIATGMDAMLKNALNGKGGMPPKGGKLDASDAEIKAVIEYIVAESQ